MLFQPDYRIPPVSRLVSEAGVGKGTARLERVNQE